LVDLEKILLINVPYFVPDAVPYGPAVVSGILNHHGYHTATWDINIDLYNAFGTQDEWELFHKNLCVGWSGNYNRSISKFVQEILTWTENAIEQKVQEYSPTIVGLSVFSSQSTDFVIPLVSLLREKLPNAYIFLGGRGLDNLEKQTNQPYYTFFIDHLPINSTYVGDAENQLIKFIQQKPEGAWIADPVIKEELENIPKSNWNGYDFSLYVGHNTKELRMPITTSKGCVRECTFCDVANSWPKFIFRKGKLVAEELIATYHLTGMNKFEFTDNLINGSVSNFREMNTVIADQLPNVLEYRSYAICRGKRESPRSDFELASVAGAKLFKIGIESGSESVRYDMKKKFTNDDIDWFSENCIDYGINQIWLMFVGYPTETEKDFQDTLAMLDRYSTAIKNNDISVWLSLPMMVTSGGNFLMKYAKEYGLEHMVNDPWKEHFWTSTIYTDNTFDIRADRWRRFVNKLNKINPNWMPNRQKEKLIELSGIEKIYEDYKQTNNKKIIPIVRTDFNEI
jgi:radical SAM superfamily enzyme YgiQ (UPF0313 family)